MWEEGVRHESGWRLRGGGRKGGKLGSSYLKGFVALRLLVALRHSGLASCLISPQPLYSFKASLTYLVLVCGVAGGRHSYLDLSGKEGKDRV